MNLRRFVLSFAVLTMIVPAAQAQTAAPASAEALQFGKMAGAACPGKWDSAECLSAISQSNFAMLSNYGGALKEKGFEADAEQVKQHCAASTAAREKAYPAYAMKSAFVECANLLTDTITKTKLQPDMSEFQLLTAAALCLGNDPSCGAVSDQLKALASK